MAVELVTLARGVPMLSLATLEDMEAMAVELDTLARGVPMLSLATLEDMDMVVMEAMAVELVTLARGVPMLSLATSEDMVDMVDMDSVVRWELLYLKVKKIANTTSIQFCKK